MTPQTLLRECEWIPPQRVKSLERLGLESVEDLLTHFPRRYEDRTRFDHFPQDETAEPVCICGLVKKTSLRRIRGRQKMFDAIIEDEAATILSTPITLRWFNAHWVEKALATGQRVVVFGKPKRSGSQVVIAHPEFEIVDDDAEVSIHLDRIAPVHRASEGLSARVLRRIIWDTLQQLDAMAFPNLVPPTLDKQPRIEALRQIHFPESHEALQLARRHLVLEEFFALQLSVAARRVEQGSRPGQSHSGSGELLARFHASLPFPLTGAQQRAIAEIRADLASTRPMNRLLHGDVGSGKTLVALSAMLLCVEAGYQAALMAPTQILAEQHYLTLHRLCEPLGLRVALRTGSRKEEAAPLPLFAAAQDLGSARVPRAGDGVAPSRTFENAASYSKRQLPHFEQPWAIYAVTFSTVERRPLSQKARDIVLDALKHHHGDRFDLIAACVMPDHVHLLIRPLPMPRTVDEPATFWPLTKILHTIKSFTAHEIVKQDQWKKAVWEKESFDRIIRSDSDLKEKFQYILRNPWDSQIVGQNESYPWVWSQDDEVQTSGQVVESSSRRDAGISTRDACAPQALLPGYLPHLVVGTHALLYEGSGLERLGLAVIDEQHKFGVLQRAKLIAQGAAPDVLVMTATPIPRTLTMTVYGDLDVSTLDEMPANRGKIITALRNSSKLPDAVVFIRQQLEAGRQAYIVYPLIDESESLEAKAAAAEFERWRGLLAPFRCELLHGRIAPEEKDATMERFRKGESHVLIATSVIEVGIDVPNSSLMLIESAERFGLAQLHQLRGRIGRGPHKSYCILISDAKEEAALEKLQTLERTANGFDIAEADLRVRGPGDILGTAQSGLPPLKLGDIFADAELMKLARNAAFLIFERDPGLEMPENQRFRLRLDADKKMALAHIS